MNTEYFRALIGCGIISVLVAGISGIPDSAIYVFFAFGVTWGRMWLAHD